QGPPLTGLAHSRIREAIYGALPDDRRRALHRAIATAIESLQRGAIDQVVEELAHHYTQAGEPARAAEYSLRAARKAQALFNFRQEVLYLERALTFLPPADARRVLINCLNSMGTVLARLGDHRKALAHFEESMKCAESLGDFGIVFGSRCNIALTQLCLGRPEVSREIFEEILGGAKQKGLT